MDKLYQKLEHGYFLNFNGKLRYLLKEHSIADLVSHIIRWLNDFDEKASESDEKYRYTLSFARDLYIGSDLSKQEKEVFYENLRAAGFFLRLSEYLYSNNQGFCSYAIYTIGKFSQHENAQYLEQAYEKEYRSVDPSLSNRCLSELSWLGSNRLPAYIDDLKNQGSIFSKLTLVLFFQSRSNTNKEFEDLITDSHLIGFIAPNQPNVSRDELLSRLVNFDLQLFNSAWSHNKRSRPQRLMKAASEFFNNFVYVQTKDEGHQSLMRFLGMD